jgi:phospholipase C
VCSQLFDHTSTIRFLEARFGVHEPNISPWHRAVSGDLTSCFDFDKPNTASLPELPDMSYATGETLVITGLPAVTRPNTPRMPEQDPGTRYSRALPYRLALQTRTDLAAHALELTFENTGSVGAVFHLYDYLHLERIPHRYTVEAGKTLLERWPTTAEAGRYDLQVIGPNGFMRRISGEVPAGYADYALPEVRWLEVPASSRVELVAWNVGGTACELKASPNSYRSDKPFTLKLEAAGAAHVVRWSVLASGLWYDFTVSCPALPGWSRGFAGRLETGTHGVSDPALGAPTALMPAGPAGPSPRFRAARST